LTAMARKNMVAGEVPFFLGCGAYKHHIPASVDHLIQRGEFLTAYTPYQPEIAQGTLQVLFEFQTQVARLLGCEVANASMYDGSTGCAEAVLMAHRITRRKKAVLSGGLHPHYRAVVETLSHWGGDSVEALEPDPAGTEDIISRIDGETSCVVVQYPSVYGTARDLTAIADAAHAKGALLIVAVAEVVALGLLKSPGEMGADIVAAEGQSIGNGLNFGGPYVGLFATREKFVRQMPGRIAGETVDAEGRRGYVLTLSTREQHIRREKATSNITTNQTLLALGGLITLCWLGPDGLRELGETCTALTAYAKERVGLPLAFDRPTFKEAAFRTPIPAREVVTRARGHGVHPGYALGRDYPGLDDVLLVALTEKRRPVDVDRLADVLAEVCR
ncbi:MAG TPA: aminomethyl-transferring glycine dehydrogenase subunit GcvPA, partial [Gaiella sp.]|uniref:aminomethyl-transferring glycine dehydrogenase subunit GcvPA n=1 Tax=Gaiella sp. TaxID=2663207 RepID=UPI002D7F8362